MHRVVKELEKKRSDRKSSTFSSIRNKDVNELEKNTLARMAALKKKQTEVLAFQIECETDAQWRSLLRREGLIIVDVYSSWAGPCTSMISTLKRVKVEVNDDRLWLAIACADNISDLLMFKDQSEPTWLFVGGGKPIKVVRGANAPKLIGSIKSEFERELLCMQGKQKRNLISIDDDVSRRRKAEAEAMRLVKLIKDEEAETADDLNAVRRDSSLRLIQLMEPYTVLVIQSFLLKTGVVTEIRDALQGDFKIEQERLVHLTEDGVRQLFRIPYKIPDPNALEDIGYNEEDNPDQTDNEGEQDENKVEGDAGSVVEGVNDGDESESGRSSSAKRSKKREKKMLIINLPDGLVGDTLIMLLESVEVRKMITARQTPAKDSVLQTADDYIQLKVGPVNYTDAVEHAPYSFHALYGLGVYQPGVWCPRRYDDKRYVMVNFFPRFVTDILMPPPASAPKYTVAIYPVDKSSDVQQQIEIYKKDVLAEGQVKIPADLVEAMANTWNSSAADADEIQSRKQAIKSSQVYAISVNRKNSGLMLALKSLDPLHVSYDVGYGKVETSKLFNNLNISLDDMPNSDEVVEKFLARAKHRIPSVSEFKEEDMPKPVQRKDSSGGDFDNNTEEAKETRRSSTGVNAAAAAAASATSTAKDGKNGAHKEEGTAASKEESSDKKDAERPTSDAEEEEEEGEEEDEGN